MGDEPQIDWEDSSDEDWDEELSLPDLPADIDVKPGPVIDSSDEFPLPSFDVDEGAVDADVLFPIGEETTAEMPPAPEKAAKIEEPTPPEAPETPVEVEEPAPPPAPETPVEVEEPTPPEATATIEEPTPPPAPQAPVESEEPATPQPQSATESEDETPLPPFPDMSELSAAEEMAAQATPAEIAAQATSELSQVKDQAADTGQPVAGDDAYFEEGLDTAPADLPVAPTQGSRPLEPTAPLPENNKAGAVPSPPPPPLPPPPVPDVAPPGPPIQIPTAVLNPPAPPVVAPVTNQMPGPDQVSTPSVSSQDSAVESAVAWVEMPSTGPNGGGGSIDEIFFEGESTLQEPPPPGEPKEDWAEIPVDQYVRRAKNQRKAPPKKKVRAWVPGLGAAAVIAALVIGPRIFQQNVVLPDTVMVVGSEPRGEVFAGDVSLGETPLTLNSEQASQALEIRAAGFSPVAVAAWNKTEGEGPVQKFVGKLQPMPVSLSWHGIPEGATVWWNGAKADISALTEAAPGSYSVKVKASDRPAVSFKATAEAGKPLAVGKAAEQEFAKQPKLQVALKPAKAGLSLQIKSLDEGQAFSSKLASGDKAAGIHLPGPGKYKIVFAGNDAFKPSSQTVEVTSGESPEITLALAEKPKVVAQPSQPSYQPSRPAYRPPAYRPAYRPPPRYSGGGGGGGRIRPPSF